MLHLYDLNFSTFRTNVPSLKTGGREFGFPLPNNRFPRSGTSIQFMFVVAHFGFLQKNAIISENG